jgi:hypothetical protein
LAGHELLSSPLPGGAGSSSNRGSPSWADVEDLLCRLVATGETVPTLLAPNTRITSYERGQRVMLESSIGSRWVALESIRECWRTFERLGCIRREDVLEPGRSSAFMIALFRKVPGVSEQVGGGEGHLVLPT